VYDVGTPQVIALAVASPAAGCYRSFVEGDDHRDDRSVWTAIDDRRRLSVRSTQPHLHGRRDSFWSRPMATETARQPH